MTSFEKLDSLLQKNKGFLKTSDAVAAGVSRTVLGTFVRKHELTCCSRLIYVERCLGRWIVCDSGRYPEAVFSHETALYLLNLANREPEPFSVTLKTGTNTAGLSKQGIKVYKVKEELFGESISVYATRIDMHRFVLRIP